MGRIVVINHVTLDGVMQAPGRPNEDTRDGFDRGGWAAERADPSLGVKMGERMGAEHAWLFGRRTYEGLLTSWNEQGGPFRDALNGTTKYVTSRDPDARLEWPNSTLLAGEATATVAELKPQVDANLVVMGSAELIAALEPVGLIDEYLLMVHPITLGRGRRLFDGVQASLALVDCTAADSGIVVATYEPASRSQGPSR